MTDSINGSDYGISTWNSPTRVPPKAEPSSPGDSLASASLNPSFSCETLLLSTHSLDPCLWGGGESDHPPGQPASLALHLASSSIIQAGYVHKSRGDNGVRMRVQLKS